MPAHMENVDVPTNLAWHYSSAAGLQGIIATHSLRATSAAYMNDANELRTGVAALKKAYEREKPNLTDEEQALVESAGMLRDSAVFSTFLVSASKEHDLLTLWRYYGTDHVAYSIGFDRNVPLMPREQVGGENHPSPPPGYDYVEWDEVDGHRFRATPDPDYLGVLGGQWRDVTYVDRDGDDSHTEYIRNYVARRQSAEGRKKFWVDFGSIADSPINLEKDSGFADECEVRILMDLNPHWKFVKFRESRFGLVPYIELSTSVDADSQGFVPDGVPSHLPIQHIMVGPTANPEAAKLALRLFLDNAGYGDVQIGSSEIPFR
ncbi:DUF2971 domain-containing protein [Cryobacterium ruanii]|uniref:DUF2971 domain-containing protein n=1 Tax=Cryobacterium ruanii TaxID=1259197 RepID=A0A4R9AQC9_9MICO|nr:DUF2971 domain-containing protein [Cryobacterium ruanii]TFD67990.1 DUF2971 domain-containing protein [Cryobacterium ruanii]